MNADYEHLDIKVDVLSSFVINTD